MWRELMQGFKSTVFFHDPATEAELMKVEQTFGISLPPDLRSLLMESNGIDCIPYFWPMEEGDYMMLILPTETMIDENREYRSLGNQSAPYWMGNVLSFAGAPNGDFVCFPIQDGRADETRIVIVSHENWSERTELPWTLRDFIRANLNDPTGGETEGS